MAATRSIAPSSYRVVPIDEERLVAEHDVTRLTDVMSEAIDAATVVVVRDGPTGIETLMLRKNASISFGGMWVFPGGRVDPEDRAEPLGDDDLGAHRAAALREAVEEADVVLPRDADGIVALSFWLPPAIEERRYATWFFVARWPDGDAGTVTIDDGEILEQQWARPADLLERRDAGEVALVPPTWVTLHTMAAHDTVDDLLDHLRSREPERFHTNATMTDEGVVVMWQGDASYDSDDLDAPGPRHRLTMAHPTWRYERTTEESLGWAVGRFKVPDDIDEPLDDEGTWYGADT